MARKRTTTPKNSEFLKVQDEWYSKLEAEGFDDIEVVKKRDTKNKRLILTDSDVVQPEIVRQYNGHFNNTDGYYQLCQQILREFKFKKPHHKIVFELHTQGKSQRAVKRILMAEHQIEMSQQGIDKLIRRTKKQFIDGDF